MTGIKHYTTTTKGIGGDLKKKISDFIVKEITTEGKVLEQKAFGEWDDKREQEFEIKGEKKEYLHVSMEKFNMDTNNAIRMICRGMYSSPKRITYAGMKDKRAITIQRLCIWNPDVEKLKEFKSRYISITDGEWSNEKITIGSLKGNSFEITIRNIDMQEKELRETTEKCFSEMKENGCANYFGEQRFGGFREITHKVGKKFIEGKVEEGVMLYLTSPSEGEEEEIAIARKNLADTKDFSKAIKEFPSKLRYERSIIHHLCKFPCDFVGAFQNMPKHMTYMFTHAYQSYLFNLVINERIESGIGLKPIEGDVEEDGFVMGPLFGFETKLCTGKPGEIEQKILDSEGIKLEDFKVKSFPELSCIGVRKKILVFPHEIKLIEINEDELNEGKLKLKTEFWLDKGNYATTIMRELMKIEKLA